MTKPAAGKQPSRDESSGPLVFILSGPSGVGKDTVLTRMKQAGYPLHYVVTLTTRPRRAAEKDGVDYRFVSRSDFEELMEKGELLEHAEVYGNRYGVPAEPVRQALRQGEDVMIKVDIQGAATIKRKIPDAISIFLSPPSMADLGRRLKQRRTESESDYGLRIETAEQEMREAENFDYMVINEIGRLDDTVREIADIIAAEKSKGVK